MAHKLGILGLTALYAGLGLAAPAIDSDAIIDTRDNININQVLTTVTIAGCGAAPSVAAGGSSGSYNGGSGSGGSTSGNPQVVLSPVVPSDQGIPHASQVVPQVSVTLHYGSSPTSGIQAQSSSAVIAIPQLNYPAINAVTASAILSVVCNGNQAVISFASSQAYSQAASSWSSAGPFTLITYSSSCGTGLDGSHDFILVQEIITTIPHTSSIVVIVQVIDVEQAVGSNTTISVQISGNQTVTGASNGNHTSTPNGANATKSACLAGSFDQSLDTSLGRSISLANSSNWAQVIPGVTPPDLSNVDDLPTLRRRDAVIQRRGIFDSIADAFKKIPLPSTPIPPITDTLKKVENEAKTAVAGLDKFSSISKSLDKNVAFNKYVTNGGSPFGDAYKVFSNNNLDVYCVGCGADGSFVISATVDFSIANGFKSGRVSANGKLNGGVVFGVVGRAGVTVPFPEQTFAQVSLGDLVVPGFLKLGPTARIGAGGLITIDATGQLQAGAKLTWPNVQATVDIIGSSSSISGWRPNIDPVFSANAIGFTIGILDNKFSKSVELIDQPGVQVTSGLQGTSSFSNGKFSGGFTGDCKGVAISAKFYNNLFADIVGVKRTDLFNYTSDPLSRCINIPSKREIDRPKYRRQVNTTAVTNTTTATSSFSFVTTGDGLFGMHWSNDSNIYVIPSNGTTATSGTSENDSDINTSDETGLFGTAAGNSASRPFIVGDSSGRALHAYTDELSKYGVSRLRAHLPDSLPATALLIGLTGVSDPNGGPDVIAALDTKGTAYYPIMCAYPSCYAKIFLAKDAVAGAAALQNLPALTGATSLTCSFVPLEGDGNAKGF